MAEWSGNTGGEMFGDGVGDPFCAGDAHFVPTVDADGDGMLDTMVMQWGTDGSDGGHGMTVVADVDGDGAVDRVTALDAEGGYTAWEVHVDPADDDRRAWAVIDEGSL